MSDWISVDERLPEIETAVLVTDGLRVGESILVGVMHWDEPTFAEPGAWGRRWIGNRVTHWMPLPDLPGGTSAD